MMTDLFIRQIQAPPADPIVIDNGRFPARSFRCVLCRPVGLVKPGWRVDWPTIAVAGAIAVGLASLARLRAHIPLPIMLADLAVLGAWYGSLQHEVIHGHPTRWKWVNLTLAAAPLGLIVPFWVYRETHLVHHIDENLTDPLLDPESYYVAPQTWTGTNGVHRWFLQARRTLLGRMLFGPVVAGYGVAKYMLRDRSALGCFRIARAIVGAAAVLFAVRATGLPIWQFVLGFGYLGQSLSLVRSFAEHRAVPIGVRAAVVQSNVFWRLLFLNNNFHLTHHRFPAVSWFRIPELHRSLDSEEAAAAGAGLYRGYGEIARRYFVRPFCQPVHPLRAVVEAEAA
jgi:fatty acid desaturase